MIKEFLKLKKETTKNILDNVLGMIIILSTITSLLTYSIIHKVIPWIVFGSIVSVVGLLIFGFLVYDCISLKMDYNYEKSKIINIIDDIFRRGGYYE